MPAVTWGNRFSFTRLWAALIMGALTLTGSAMLFAAVVNAQPAHTSYAFAGTDLSFGGGLSLARRLAVDPASHNVLVTEAEANRISVFQPNGSALEPLSQFGAGVLNAPYGIAIDSVSRYVYVSDVGDQRIVRFTYTSGANPTYTQDLSYTSPALGSAAGEVGSFEAALAVDPTTHDLLVADPADKRVSRFTAAGAFVGSFDGSDTAGGVFVRPTDIAVGGTGAIVVLDGAGAESPARVERFASDGTSQGSLESTGTPESVTVDQSTGMILVGVTPTMGEGPDAVLGFIGAELVTYVPLHTAGFIPPISLAVDAGGSGDLYALSSLGFIPNFDTVEALTPVLAPGVAIGAPGAVTSTSATLTGTVDPGGQTTTPHFEYSTDGTEWTPLLELAQLSGSGETTVHGQLTGLQPDMHYFIRLIAANEATKSTTGPLAFDTQPAPPEALTQSANGVSVSAARLLGQVNPFGLQSTYHFEYGQSTSYGQRVPADSEAPVGAGRVLRSVAQPIAGLQAGAVYHYRLVATNAAGTSYGSDQTLTTPAQAEVPRAYELVSPVGKGILIRTSGEFQAGSDGNGFAFTGSTASTDPSISEGSPGAPRYAAIRTSTGWQTRGTEPPINAESSAPALLYGTFGVSDDMQHALVSSNHALTPGAVAGQFNIYLRDVQTGVNHLINVATVGFGNTVTYSFQALFAGASKDWSKVVVYSSGALNSEVPPGGIGLYEYSGGHTRLASLLPDGSAADGTALTAANAVSEDGSRLAFATVGGSHEGAYLRAHDQTIAISVSHRPGDPGTVHAARIQGSSRDGRYVVFQVSEGVPLTSDAPAVSGDVYRYDAETGALTYLVGSNDSSGVSATVLGMSEDASTVLFEFLGGPDTGLVVWRNGHSRLVSSRFRSSGLFYFPPQLSPDGRYLAVDSFAPLTDQDITNAKACPTQGSNYLFEGSCPEVYLFDLEGGEPECASCASDGSHPAGVASLSAFSMPGHASHPVDDAGQVFFDTPTSLVGEDTNGTSDVYEFAAGQPRLISRGRANTQSYFADATDDGKNVFFVTNDQLVGQDQDRYFEVYDARVGGGFPEPAVRAACSGDACQGAPDSTPSLASAGSITFLAGPEAAGTLSPATRSVPKAKVSVSGKALKGSAFTLAVKVPAKGRIAVTGAGLRSVTHSAGRAATYRLKLRLTGKAAKTLTARHRLKVKVRVVYTPAGGKSSASALSVTLKA